MLRLADSIDPYIEGWAEELERSRWPGWIVDNELRLRFISSELKAFMTDSLGREVDDQAAGVGQNILEALTNEAWSATVSPDSLSSLMPRIMGYLKDEFGDSSDEYVPEGFLPLLEAAPQTKSWGVLSDRFQYIVPGLPPYPVEFLLVGLRAEDGQFLGVLCVSQGGLRPTLVSLLSRGDERMYERMAKLREPRRCRGAILFADLEGSTRLSRALPTSTYFSFIRALATSADNAVAANEGVVGRHAGDGVSGFFLVSEGVDESAIATATINAAREIQKQAREALEEVVKDLDIDPSGYGMNVGLHWGASIFMGQLVPGGRLDVTALGDSVNECARIQEAASGGALFASKQLVEQLSPEDAAQLGLDVQKLVYSPIAELDNVSPKVSRDAGLIPVTRLN